MKFVHTFWANESNFLLRSNGFLNVKYFLASWLLSFESIHRFYDNIELVTNNYGKYLIIDLLGLPYKNVVIQDFDNDELSEYGLWSLNKLKSYSLHEEPFLNIDGDVFLFEKLDDKLLNGSLIGQNKERNLAFYTDTCLNINNYFSDIPDYFKLIDTNEINAVCAGLMGGQDYLFFKSYSDKIFDLVYTNHSKLSKIDSESLNIFLEQCLIIYISSIYDKKFNYLLDHTTTPDYHVNLNEFELLPGKCKYIHLMSGKKNLVHAEMMLERLYIDFPNSYNLIFTVLKNLDIKDIDNVNSTYILDDGVYIKSQKESLTINSFKCSRDDLVNLNILFYRTYIFLNSVDINLSSFNSVNYLIECINNLNNYLFFEKILDVFNYELSIFEFFKSTSDEKDFYKKKLNDIKEMNSILQSAGLQDACFIFNSNFVLLDTLWNWTELNEFNHYDKPNYVDNINVKSFYFQVLVFYYPNIKYFREILLDPLSILIFDGISSSSSFDKIVEHIYSEISKNNVSIDKKYLFDQIFQKVSFYLYLGVISISK